MFKKPTPSSIDQYVDELLSRDSAKIKLISVERDEANLVVENWGIEELLENFVNRGFILHGQPPKADKLIPRKGHGQATNEKLIAIYATNIPAIAIFHATTDIYKLAQNGLSLLTGWSVECSKTGKPQKIIFRSSQKMIENMSDGYVYVCDEKYFEKIDPVQFICLEEYIPRIRIPVVGMDFKHLIEIDAIDRQAVELA